MTLKWRQMMNDIAFTFLIMAVDRKQGSEQKSIIDAISRLGVIALHFLAISISYGVKYVLERYKEMNIFTASLKIDFAYQSTGSQWSLKTLNPIESGIILHDWKRSLAVRPHNFTVENAYFNHNFSAYSNFSRNVRLWNCHI